ncbi:DUF421 domain-containing protein [Clostridium niameyense]|uniref:DUF421 domain-containing protein n=1 Tax=Clostridium niameyense TaxID=1622073 RepID=A0A6M0RCS8_9CLOT|nr:DUF421 domain-containing protein [Clostridium niameyense]NEZ46968.1 DUF421 domain-containing protein [Clostridium niameyense]
MNNYINILVRSIISFIILLFVTRLMGKKQMSQLTFFDYIVGITIGSIAAEVSVDNSVLLDEGIISLLVWSILPILLGFLALKNIPFRKMIDGEPTVIIKSGEVIRKNLAKNKLNIEDLIMKLREKGAFNIDEIDYAILEANGEISVLFRQDKQSITPSDLNIQNPYKGLPKTVIEDGVLLEKKMKSLGISKAWLMNKLAYKNIYEIKDVFIAQVDDGGNIYIDIYEKNNGM